MLSPTAPACVPQDHLEPVLLEHLRSLGGARVHLHTEVDRRRRTVPDGVEVVLRDVATGDLRTVRARYLIAADGAHSRIRAALGIAMHGSDGLAHVVNGALPSAAVAPPRRAPLRHLLRRPPGRRRARSCPRAAATAGSTERGWTAQDAERHTPERFVRRIRAGAGIADLDVSIERIGAFSFAAQLADRFRDGNVFLAGDAAHRVTPRGGTGMNTAIRGGHDLGWKLGWVLRGWAGPELLDTYEAERRPIAAHNVARSADPNGSTRETADELHVDLGGRIAHVWVSSDRGACPRWTCWAPASRCSRDPTRPRRRPRRTAGRRSPCAVWTPSARGRWASAVALRCWCAPTARPRGCGRRRRQPA